jgi:hypothetical protein
MSCLPFDEVILQNHCFIEVYKRINMPRFPADQPIITTFPTHSAVSDLAVFV